MKTIKLAALLFGVLALLVSRSVGQTNLQFTGVNATDENAIQLHWTSTNGELYQIQYANALATNADGTTAWQILYDDYPSQGTNTFVGDFGNYNFAPAVVHPKNSPIRFYRILDKGADSLSDEPTISVTSPTNGTAVSGELTITVVAATDQPVISGTKLYVDGQEMQPPDDTTNWTDGSTNYEMATFSINTCEWGNEIHTLFATVQNQSGYSDVPNSPSISIGHGVSPFVPVLFSNLITRISFSQPSFDPSSGETQQVSAVFAANCDWTLNICDIYSNVVQTASGSGISMLYNWDGTSNGVSIPNGIYYYYINAETNGESDEVVTGGGSGGSGGGSPPSPDFAFSDSSELWAMSADGDDAVPLALYPPGFDTNSLTILSATPSEINAARASASRASFSSVDSDSFSPDASGGGSSAGSQGSSAAPQRPPNNPIKGSAGTVGVANDTYTANGSSGFNTGPLDNGLGIGQHIAMDTFSAGASLNWGELPTHKAEGNNFISQMQHWGWKSTINKIDNQLNINDLRGGGSPFNNVDLGIFIGHGCYGTSIDYAANGCKQMYYPITSGGSAQYLRLSEMALGGSSSTNGLKWFALKACDSLHQANWSNMQNLGVKPYNSNLHLLLGTTSTSYSNPNIEAFWAKYMNHGTSTNYSPLTIRAAWYQAAKDAYKNSGIPTSPAVKFAVAGDTSCMSDSLQSYYTPGGSWGYDSQQVYP
jgi:hypothetical protein